MNTNLGAITLELDDTIAPNTVTNFLRYVTEGFYSGTLFHRVMKGFMIQWGWLEPGMIDKKWHHPIEHEGANGLKNTRGTIAMARTNDPHSATSQFFINTVDNDFLDFTRPSGMGWGYAVFWKVTEGMEVVDAIERVPTTRRAGHDDVPRDDIIIESVEVVA